MPDAVNNKSLGKFFSAFCGRYEIVETFAVIVAVRTVPFDPDDFRKGVQIIIKKL